MKKSLLMFVLALLVAAPLSVLNGTTAHAATVNTAIRGTSAETVYWYANDGKRYVFPNAATYFTWFPSFNSVITISDAELVSIPLGGNVTYRPGAKLVKINTDPRTYAVAKGGVLRHVTSESLASQLYGSDWRSDVHDIPDVYFTNYVVGTPIYNASDFNVSNEYHGVTTPSDSLRSNGGGQTGDLVLNASRTSINPGEAVQLIISHTTNYGSGYRLEIYDTRTNSLIRTCNIPTTYCDVTVYPQRNGTETSVQYYVALRDVSSTTIKSGYSPVIYFGGSTGTSFSSGSVRLDVNRTSVMRGETVTLTATASNLNTDASNISMHLYQEGLGNLIETCSDKLVCTFNRVVSTNENQSSFRFYVSVRNDVTGEQLPVFAFSPAIMVSDTSTSNDLTIWTDKTSINSGDSITVSAWSSQTFNASRIEIYDERDNNLVFTCYSVQNCSQSRTFFRRNTSENSFRLYAQLKDWNGTVLRTAYTPTMAFNGTTQTGSVTLNADRTTVTQGQSVTLSANYSGTLPTGGYLRMTQQTYGSAPNTVTLSTCYSNSCSYTYTFSQNSSVTLEYHFRAYVMNANHEYVAWNSPDLIVQASPNTSSNNGDNRINGLVLNADRTNINAGERVRLTANAFNSGTWSYTGNRIDIVDAHRGTIVKTCYDSSTCVADVYPQAQSSTNLTAQYQARIYDRNGVLAMTQYSPVIYLTSYAGGTNSALGTGLITYAPTDALKPNRNVYLTATFSGSNIPQYDAQVRIYTEQSSSPIAVCNGSYNCSVSYPTGSTPMTTRIYAQLSNRYSAGTYAETPRVNLTTTW